MEKKDTCPEKKEETTVKLIWCGGRVSDPELHLEQLFPLKEVQPSFKEVSFVLEKGAFFVSPKDIISNGLAKGGLLLLIGYTSDDDEENIKRQEIEGDVDQEQTFVYEEATKAHKCIERLKEGDMLALRGDFKIEIHLPEVQDLFRQINKTLDEVDAESYREPNIEFSSSQQASIFGQETGLSEDDGFLLIDEKAKGPNPGFDFDNCVGGAKLQELRQQMSKTSEDSSAPVIVDMDFLNPEHPVEENDSDSEKSQNNPNSSRSRSSKGSCKTPTSIILDSSCNNKQEDS